MSTPAPCGSWRSPISARKLAEESVGLGALQVDGDDLYWIEGRAADQGRQVVVRRTPDGTASDVTGAPHNARTRVHEYGGGAYTVHRGTVWYSNFADGRLYRIDPGEPPRPITREGGLRYADMVFDARRNRLICVREDHEHPAPSATPGAGDRPPEPRNTIVSLPADGDGEQRVLVEGGDFYAAPRLDPAGERLCWLSWNHPDMPWDGCELWTADVADDEGSLADARQVAGSREESIFQPAWSPDGVLYFVSDRTGWWNLYRIDAGGDVEALTAERAEFGQPQWSFGVSQYAFDGPERIACTYILDGVSYFGVLDTASRALTPLRLPYTAIGGSVRARGGHAFIVAGSPTEPRAVVEVDLDSGASTVLRSTSASPVDPAYISAPETLEFPTEHGKNAYGFFYAPRNRDFSVPDGELPPLLVRTHGGPTHALAPMLDLDVQYWTSRGIAVLDVNYGGSSGYGREYRQRLDGAWGVVDVDDCVNGALHLAAQGRVDRNRLLINGGSAGGYTTLCALTFRDSFAAGASHYGVADLELLARDTHKFESRYLDRLVGPYPAAIDTYRARSPIHHTDQLSRPVILFQGLDDRVVPPDQAEAMFEAVDHKGLPCALVTFEGEDHGFRKAESIVRAHDGELYFYSRIFGFDPADAIEPVQIHNLPPR
jgi:dipeptidyl aminopeptidase/acylaminoacyl peptidase